MSGVIPIISAIEPVTADTAVWFVDIWGVLHNGVAPFASAVAACRMFRSRGGIVVLVSNAPRPAASVATQLDRIGVAREAYDAIQSSGDTARGLIADLKDRAIYHLGPQRDLAIYDGLDVTLSEPGGARAIVCTGLVDDERETAGTYRELLEGFAGRAVPMICANPDLTVERGGRIIPCAGALAALYEAQGGAVNYAGKPYPPIYEAAFALADRLARYCVPRERILAIGDGVRTDIAGAAKVGLRSVYVASAVSLEGAALDAASLARLFPDPAIQPVVAMERLQW